MTSGKRGGSGSSGKEPVLDASATPDNELRPWATNRATDHKVCLYIYMYVYISYGVILRVYDVVCVICSYEYMSYSLVIYYVVLLLLQLERALASLDSITSLTAPNKFAGGVGHSTIDNTPAILRDFYAFLKKGDGGWSDLVIDQGNLDDAIQCFLSQSGTEYMTTAAEDRSAAMAATNSFPMLDSNGKYVLDDKNQIVLIENANLSHNPALLQQEPTRPSSGYDSNNTSTSNQSYMMSMPPIAEDQEVLQALTETLRLSVLNSTLFDEFNFSSTSGTGGRGSSSYNSMRPGSGLALTLRTLNEYVNQREKPLHRTYLLTNTYNRKLKIKKLKTYKGAVFRSQYDWFRTTLTSRQRALRERSQVGSFYLCFNWSNLRLRTYQHTL